MNDTQDLLNQLQNLDQNLTIKIEYSQQLYADGKLTPYLVVMFGKDYGHRFDTGFIHKTTGEFKFESELNIRTEINDYYEFFEGGYEDNINDCLIRLITNIKLFRKDLI